MNESPTLLHNMSAPPKSVVKYEGLSGLVKQSGPGGSGVTALKFKGSELFGQAVRFALPEALEVASAADILRGIGVSHDEALHGSAHRHLLRLIRQRAAELPLPEGCAVIKSTAKQAVVWDDPLAALTAITQSTDTVWLRGKTPTLSALMQRRVVTLLLPPTFALPSKEDPT